MDVNLNFRRKEETYAEAVRGKLLRMLFKFRKGKVTGGWRNLKNGELRNLYSCWRD
jgi:hypothetical protein